LKFLSGKEDRRKRRLKEGHDRLKNRSLKPSGGNSGQPPEPRNQGYNGLWSSALGARPRSPLMDLGSSAQSSRARYMRRIVAHPSTASSTREVRSESS